MLSLFIRLCFIIVEGSQQLIDPVCVFGDRIPGEAQIGEGSQVDGLSQPSPDITGGRSEPFQNLFAAFHTFQGGYKDIGVGQFTVYFDIGDEDAFQPRIAEIEEHHGGKFFFYPSGQHDLLYLVKP